jgi:hypothetical protein
MEFAVEKFPRLVLHGVYQPLLRFDRALLRQEEPAPHTGANVLCRVSVNGLRKLVERLLELGDGALQLEILLLKRRRAW